MGGGGGESPRGTSLTRVTVPRLSLPVRRYGLTMAFGMGARGHESLVALVGRSAERDAVCSVIEEAARGRTRAVVIEGEAGIGKTRLLTEALSFAEGMGFRIICGACDEVERDQPLRALVEALGAGRSPATGGRPELGDLLRIGAGPPERPAAVLGAVDGSWVLVESVVDILDDLASMHPDSTRGRGSAVGGSPHVAGAARCRAADATDPLGAADDGPSRVPWRGRRPDHRRPAHAGGGARGLGVVGCRGRRRSWPARWSGFHQAPAVRAGGAGRREPVVRDRAGAGARRRRRARGARRRGRGPSGSRCRRRCG